MTRRSIPQQLIDERRFAVQMIVLVPVSGFGPLMGLGRGSIYAWLNEEVGRDGYAQHPGGRRATASGIRNSVAFHFRHPEAAARFLAAFPVLELANA